MAAAHEQQQGKEFFNLDFEDEDEPQPEQPAATSASRYAAAGPVPTPPAKPTPPVYSGGRPVGAGRPGRGSNLVAADPEKTRVVGVRPAPPPTQQQPVAASASLCATASAAATQPSSSSPSLQLLQQQPNEQSAPPQPAFEGRGLQEVGTLKRPASDDDEFDYAFEGGKREGDFHKQVFKPKAMPAHLVSNVKQNLNSEVLQEEDEEGEMEEDEEEEADEEDEQQEEEEDGNSAGGRGEDDDGKRPAGTFLWQTADMDHSGVSGLMDDGTDPGGQLAHKAAGGGLKPSALGTSWTTFTPSENPSFAFDQLPDDLATAGQPPGASGARASAQGLTDAGPTASSSTPATDLPSYKVIQALANNPDRTSGTPNGSKDNTPGGPGQPRALLDGSGSSGMGRSVLRKDANPADGFELAGDIALAGAAAAAAAAASPITTTTTTSGAAAASSGAAALAPAPPGAARPPAQAPSRRMQPPPPAAPQQQQGAGQQGAGHVGEVLDEWDEANRERHTEMEGAKPALASSSSAAAAAAAAGSGAGTAVQPSRASATPTTVAYKEALQHLMATDVSAHRGAVSAGLPPPPGFLARLLCLAPQELRPPALQEQMVQLLGLARVPFSDADPMHLRLLCSLYAAFTGKSAEQSRCGGHWADVGFQGDDPATDLRSCGVLGLVHLYGLYGWDAGNALRMYRLSRSEAQEFPLAIVSLNVTKWALQVMREGALNGEANARQSMVEALQDFHAGTMCAFYSRWLEGKKTMRDSGFVLRDLEAYVRKKPGAVCQAAHSGKPLQEP